MRWSPPPSGAALTNSSASSSAATQPAARSVAVTAATTAAVRFVPSITPCCYASAVAGPNRARRPPRARGHAA